MKPSDLVLAVPVMMIWGGNFVAVRIGVLEMPPIFFVSLRFACVFLLLVPFVSWPRGRLRDLVVLSFFLGTLHFALTFTASRYIEAGTMAIVSQLQAVFAALLARLWFNERLKALGWTGMAIALAGIVLIAGEPAVGVGLWALPVAVLGYFGNALYQAHLKRVKSLAPNELNCWVSLLIVPQTLALSLALEHDQWEAIRDISWIGFGALFYQVIPMVMISYWVWYRLLYRYPLTRVAPFQMLMPVFGMLAGTLLLSEPLTTLKVIGGAATVIGVSMIVLRPEVTPKTTPGA